MSGTYLPTPCTFPIAYLGGARIGDCYVTGQPSDPPGVRAIAAAGVKAVMCLRDPSEPGFDFDESGNLHALGVGYTNIPFPHGIDQADFDLRADLVRGWLASAPRPLLMHCSSGDRASALWAVHLSADLGVPIDQAIEFARYSGLANPPFVDLVRHYSPHPAPAGAVFAAAGLRIAAYGEGAMYPPNLAANVAALRTAGWSTLMLGLFHIDATGDLYFNDTPLISAGKYVGDAGWPKQLGQLIQPGQSTIQTLLASFGGGGVGDFANIMTIYQNNNNSFTGTTLEKNFQTFSTTFPMIALIDMDVENTYDQTSFVAFCQMLAGIRFGITFCPYDSVSFWVDSLAALNQSNPGAVKWWNLQCYDGGNLNDPDQWAQAIVTKIRTFNPTRFIVAGDWSRNLARPQGIPPYWQGRCPPAVTTHLTKFKTETCVAGGFIWTIDSILDYAKDQKILPDPAPCGNVGMSDYVKAIITAL